MDTVIEVYALSEKNKVAVLTVSVPAPSTHTNEMFLTLRGTPYFALGKSQPGYLSTPI